MSFENIKDQWERSTFEFIGIIITKSKRKKISSSLKHRSHGKSDMYFLLTLTVPRCLVSSPLMGLGRSISNVFLTFDRQSNACSVFICKLNTWRKHPVSDGLYGAGYKRL